MPADWQNRMTDMRTEPAVQAFFRRSPYGRAMAPPHWARVGRRGTLILGVIGTTCMTVGGFAYATMPSIGTVARFGPLQDLRAWSGAHTAGLALGFLGLALLTGAWLLLGAAVRAGAVAVPGVHRAALLWAVPLLLAPPLFSEDSWIYVAYGYIDGQGTSPYVATPAHLPAPILDAVCRCWRHTPAPYGPLPLMWGGAFSHVTSHPWPLMLSYRLLALIGLGLLMFAVPRLSRLAGQRPAVASWLAVASPFVLAHGVGGTHLDLVMVGLIALALVVTVSRGWLAGALLVGVATAVKAPAAIAGVGVVLLTAPTAAVMTRLWYGVRIALVTLGTVAGIGLVGGLGIGWVHTLAGPMVLQTPLSLTFQAGRLLSGLLGADVAPIASAVGLGLLLLCCGLLLWRTPAGRTGTALTATGVAMLLATVLSPVANYWYYLWCVPLLACCRLPAWAQRCLFALVVVLGLTAPFGPALHLHSKRDIALGLVIGGLALALVWDRLAAINRKLPIRTSSGRDAVRPAPGDGVRGERTDPA